MDAQGLAYVKLSADFEQQKILLDKQLKLSTQLQMALEILNRNLIKEKEKNEKLQNKLAATEGNSEMLQSFTRELKKANVEIKDLKNIELTYERQVEQLSSQILTLEGQQVDLQNQNERLQKETVSYQKRDQDFAILEADFVELKKINEIQQAELEQERVSNELVVGQYKDALMEIKANQNAHEEVKVELECKLTNVEEEKNKFEQQYKHILEQSTESQLTFQEEKAQLASQLQYVADEKERIEQQMKAQSITIEEGEAKIEMLEIQVQYTTNKMDDQMIKIEQLKKELLDKQVEYLNRVKEVENWATAYELLEQQLQDMKLNMKKVHEKTDIENVTQEQIAVMELKDERIQEMERVLEAFENIDSEELLKGNVIFADEVAKIQQFITELNGKSNTNLLLNEALEAVKNEVLL